MGTLQISSFGVGEPESIPLEDELNGQDGSAPTFGFGLESPFGNKEYDFRKYENKPIELSPENNGDQWRFSVAPGIETYGDKTADKAFIQSMGESISNFFYNYVDQYIHPQNHIHDEDNQEGY